MTSRVERVTQYFCLLTDSSLVSLINQCLSFLFFLSAKKGREREPSVYHGNYFRHLVSTVANYISLSVVLIRLLQRRVISWDGRSSCKRAAHIHTCQPESELLVPVAILRVRLLQITLPHRSKSETTHEEKHAPASVAFAGINGFDYFNWLLIWALRFPNVSIRATDVGWKGKWEGRAEKPEVENSEGKSNSPQCGKCTEGKKFESTKVVMPLGFYFWLHSFSIA